MSLKYPQNYMYMLQWYVDSQNITASGLEGNQQHDVAWRQRGMGRGVIRRGDKEG